MREWTSLKEMRLVRERVGPLKNILRIGKCGSAPKPAAGLLRGGGSCSLEKAASLGGKA